MNRPQQKGWRAHFWAEQTRRTSRGLRLVYNVERMSSGGLEAPTFRLTTKIEKKTKLKY